jgi:hypothetical protein
MIKSPDNTLNVVLAWKKHAKDKPSSLFRFTVGDEEKKIRHLNSGRCLDELHLAVGRQPPTLWKKKKCFILVVCLRIGVEHL